MKISFSLGILAAKLTRAQLSLSGAKGEYERLLNQTNELQNNGLKGISEIEAILNRAQGLLEDEERLQDSMASIQYLTLARRWRDLTYV